MTPGVLVCWSGYAPRLQVTRVPPQGLILGRAFASPTDERISATHARVWIEDGSLGIEDLGSRNGTFAGGFQQDRARLPLPQVLRLGHTVFAAVRDVEPYEGVTEPVVGAAFAAAERAVVAAARAEHNLTIEAGYRDATALVERYVATIGGERVVFDASRAKQAFDDSLAMTRPRVVVLDLTNAALSRHDMPALATWLETDVRFITMSWPEAHVLSTFDPAMLARMRECVVQVGNPRFDELPLQVVDIVRTVAPDIRIHATTIEGMLDRSTKFDAAWVVARFERALAAWRARMPNQPEVRMQDLIDDIDPPPSGAYCLVGGLRGRRSF